MTLKPEQEGSYLDYLIENWYSEKGRGNIIQKCENPCYYILSKEDWRFDKFCIIPSGFNGGTFNAHNRFQNNLNHQISTEQMKDTIGKDLYDKIYEHWQEWMEEHPEDTYDFEGEEPDDDFHLLARVKYYEKAGHWRRGKLNRQAGTVDVTGNVDFEALGWERGGCRAKFGTVSGDFDCQDAILKKRDLEWFPLEVGGNMICTGSTITSLENLRTKTIGGDFIFTDYSGDAGKAEEKLKGIVKGKIRLGDYEGKTADQEERNLVNFLDKVCRAEWRFRMENGERKVDCDGNVNIAKGQLAEGKLPVKFGKITGEMLVEDNMEDLWGMPDEVGYWFKVFGSLKSFDNSPSVFTGSFLLPYGETTSFKGLPSIINGNLRMSVNSKIKTPEGFPDKITGEVQIVKYAGDLDQLMEFLDGRVDGQIYVSGGGRTKSRLGKKKGEDK
jgi:hypothetical protein